MSERQSRRQREESLGLPIVEVVGIAVLLIGLLAAVFFFSLDILVALGILTAVGGTAKLIFRLREDEGDELPPASAAFRALADPTRPLAGDAPISRTRMIEDAASSRVDTPKDAASPRTP